MLLVQLFRRAFTASALPAGHLLYASQLSLRFTLAFGLVYGGGNLWAQLIGASPVPRFPWETGIPLLPEAAWLYLSLLPLMWSAPFVLRAKEHLLLAYKVLMLQLVVAGGCFFFLPSAAHDRQVPQTIINENMAFYLADIINLDYNAYPSLHVCFSFSLCFIYLGHLRLYYGAILILWTTAIILSTLFLHQHSLLDVAGGVVLALVTTITVQQKKI